MKKIFISAFLLFFMTTHLHAQGFETMDKYWQKVETNLTTVPVDRQDELKSLANYIAKSIKQDGNVDLMFICTHNSRRSHFGQIWAAAAAHHGWRSRKVPLYSIVHLRQRNLRKGLEHSFARA
jgi:hypothetical protein